MKTKKMEIKKTNESDKPTLGDYKKEEKQYGKDHPETTEGVAFGKSKPVETPAPQGKNNNASIQKQIEALDKKMPKDRIGENDAIVNNIKAQKEALRKGLVP